MNREKKAEMAQELLEKFTKSQVTILADYRGVKASEADELRKLIRDGEGEVRVVKNSVAHLVAKNDALEIEAKEVFSNVVGPTLVAFGYKDPAATAKVFHQFTKDHEALEIKEGLIGQKKTTAAGIEALADLPPREVLLSMVLAAMQGPISGLVQVLAAVPRSLLNVMNAIGEQKKS